MDSVNISIRGMAKYMDTALVKKNFTPPNLAAPAPDEDSQLPSKLQIAKVLLEKFFGIKIEIVDLEAEAGKNAADGEKKSAPPPDQAARQGGEPELQGWGMHYTYHEVNYKKESVQFKAEGAITTEDGREFQFASSLEMSKETMEEINIEIKAGDALVDPLVVNLDGKGAQLTDEKIEFDLDMDGDNENISFLSQGSGFLALDKNGNGVVDDGSELFGPATNHGFLELKAYDTDQNDWIDEADSIFYDLRIWTKNEDGSDQLSSLQDHNLGAIYLNSAATNFDLNEGQLKDTGIYLRENGSSGFIQEVDLKVS